MALPRNAMFLRKLGRIVNVQESVQAEKTDPRPETMKPTSSTFLHCDWHAGHYLKLVMDAIFGKDNFRNEIAWYYTR